MMARKIFPLMIFSLFLVFMVPLLGSSLVYALNLGISPAAQTFNSLLRNGYVEEIFTIFSTTNTPIFFRFEDLNDTPVHEWITVRNLSNGEVLKQNTTYSVQNGKLLIKLEATIPGDIPNGVYKTRFLVYAADNTTAEGITALALKTRVAADLTFEITDVERPSCFVRDFSVTSNEQGNPVTLSFFFRNTGNVIAKPTVLLNVWDQNQNQIIKSLTVHERSFKPSVFDTYKVNISTGDLEPGQYWLDVKVPECNDELYLLTFDVLKPGELSQKGIFKTFHYRSKNPVGVPIPLTVVFENQGEQAVEAKFKGGIWLGDTLVKVLESETLRVPPQTDENFTVYFTPEREGRYTFKGRFFYGKKQTYEKSSPIYVFPRELYEQYHGPVNNEETKQQGSHWILWLIVGLVILFGVLIILKKKRQQRRGFYEF